MGEIYAAPLDVALDPSNVVQPDLLYVSKPRRAIVTERNVQGAPDLIVEILSEPSQRIDRIRKLRLYARCGVAHYWIVDPAAESIEEYVLQADHYRVAARVEVPESFVPEIFADLTIPLAELFARPLPEAE